MKILIILSIFAGSLLGQQATGESQAIQKDFPTLDGFAEAQWGMNFDSVKEKFQSLSTNPESKEKIEFLNEVKDKIIIMRRNGIQYTYRFYTTPDNLKEIRLAANAAGTATPDPNAGANANPQASNNSVIEAGILYSVSVQLRMIESAGLLGKMEAKYGKPKKETSSPDKNSGAYVWELTDSRDLPPRGGFIIQWKEGFKSKSYSRRIDYLSATVKDQIDKDYKDYFSTEEAKALRDLLN
jgi:hypothetical protein